MMVKVKEEDDAPALLPAAAGAEPMSPLDGDYYYNGNDEEEGEEATDSDGGGYDGAARRAGEPPLKKGPWTADEDRRLRDYVEANGEGNWNQVRINAGLNRCGKSCRLRWSNHLRPDLKKGPFEDDEVEKIIWMHMTWGNKWAKMAAALPGRTDNEIKNFWNTRLKRHQRAGLPIYPEYLVSQYSNQDPNFGTPEASHGTKRPNELSHNVLEIGNLQTDYFDHFDHNTFCKHVPLPDMDVPCSSLVGPNSLQMDAINSLELLKPSGCAASDYCGILSSAQIPSTSLNYGMTEHHLAPPSDAILSGHPMFDGNPSTSWATQRPMKTELPSVQYCNPGFSNAWVGDDKLIESPGSMKSESISQGDCEVLPPHFSCSQVPPSNVYGMWPSFPSAPGDDEIDGSPFSSDAILSESKCYTGQDLSPWTEVGTLDASLEESMFNESLFLKDQSSSIYEDFSEEAKLSTAGPGLVSFPWDSMCGASNMSDFSDL